MTWKSSNKSMSVFDYTEFTSSIQRAWITYVEKGVGPEHLIRPEILSSWERSRMFGVNPFQMQIEDIIDQSALNEVQEQNDKLLQLARPDMRLLADSMEGTETIITIADRNGWVLEMYGDPSIRREAEKIHFMPGALWSEEAGGTNAIGTVIKNHQAVQILFTEHFCTGWHDWFCAAAPIMNPLTNELVGVLDISGKWKNVHPHTLGLAISKANHLSKFIGKTIYLEALRANPFLITALGSVDDGILIADTRKNILKMNPKMESILKGIRNASLNHIPELARLAEWVLTEKEPHAEEEIVLQEERRKWLCSIQPVMMDSDRIVGIVIRLRETQFTPQTKEVKSVPGKASNHGVTRYTFEHMIGSSPAFMQAVNKAKKAAALHSTLFLSGETGTGKELFAQAIHAASERRDKPFVAINCGAIPRELIESELFGYEPGAFTGAKSKGSPGKFELAHGGTIFLDEIGDMPLHVQVHLLRVLEERVVTRIGGQKPIPIDVRVIAATHKNLLEAVREGTFREDLLFRLRVIQLRLPALRERSSDIPRLVYHFIKQLGGAFGKTNIQVDPEVLECLKNYTWPGNIRELKNVIEQSLFNMEGDVLLPCDLPPELAQMSTENHAESERDHLLAAITAADGNVTQAAERLGISRATIYRKMKEYGITADLYKTEFTHKI